MKSVLSNAVARESTDTPAAAVRRQSQVLGVPVDLVDWDTAVERILGWAQGRESRYVSICDAHSIVRASREHAHGKHIREADMVTPDGWPVAWMLRRTAAPTQQRIDGPDLMWRLLAKAEAMGLRVFFYGTTPATLNALEIRLSRDFPGLQVAGRHAPPFRSLSPTEDALEVAMINASGAHLVMTGLGCPKEDRWMNEHRGRIQAVTLGIGAGIDYWAGGLRRAPYWMREHGLEWSFRLLCEPRRLWRRYLVYNSRFILGAAVQLWRHRQRPDSPWRA